MDEIEHAITQKAEFYRPVGLSDTKKCNHQILIEGEEDDPDGEEDYNKQNYIIIKFHSI